MSEVKKRRVANSSVSFKVSDYINDRLQNIHVNQSSMNPFKPRSNWTDPKRLRRTRELLIKRKQSTERNQNPENSIPVERPIRLFFKGNGQAEYRPRTPQIKGIVMKEYRTKTEPSETVWMTDANKTHTTLQARSNIIASSRQIPTTRPLKRELRPKSSTHLEKLQKKGFDLCNRLKTMMQEEVSRDLDKYVIQSDRESEDPVMKEIRYAADLSNSKLSEDWFQVEANLIRFNIERSQKKRMKFRSNRLVSKGGDNRTIQQLIRQVKV